jgi:hypothetical protein
MAKRTDSTISRFNKKIDIGGLRVTDWTNEEDKVKCKELGCWIWDGAIKNKSRGSGRVPCMQDPTTGTIIPAYRIAWRLFRSADGSIDPDTGRVHDKFVTRSCAHQKSYLCVNPEHLMLSDGPSVLSGENHPQAVLNTEAVRRLRARTSRKRITLQTLATQHGVTKEAIRKIVCGESDGGVKIISSAVVKKIREDYEPPTPLAEIACLPHGTKVSKSALASVVAGRTWKHVKVEDGDEREERSA